MRCTCDQRLAGLVRLIDVVEVEDFRVPVPQLLAQSQKNNPRSLFPKPTS
jgi:hypothetical protein